METREHIVCLEQGSIVANLRRPAFAHEWTEYEKTVQSDVEGRLQDATIAIINKLKLDADMIARLPKLRMIAVSATGTNAIDLEACRARGIAVSNIRGYAVHTVPEHAMALMLALSRNLLAWRESVQAGRWQQSEQFCYFDYPIRDLHGSTLTVIGSGSLSQGLVRLAEAFGMRIIRAERKHAAQCRDGYTPFPQALSEADIVSLHCPLTPETQGLIGEAELRTMKKSALLINTARGGLVDETALVRALKEGWIAGAGFDVLSEEPPRNGDPLLAPELLAFPNFLLTPHVAWSSRPAMQTLADQLIENIEAFVRGGSQNRVV